MRLQRVKANGSGWTARCPAHNDLEPSLKIDQGEDGRVLLYCHAGCATPDIVRALGLRMSDLFLRRRLRPVLRERRVLCR